MEKVGAERGLDVRISTHIEARPATVFGILADPGGVSRWLGGEASFEPRVGSPFRVAFPQFGLTIEGEVLAVEQNEAIAFSWGATEGPQAETMPSGSTRLELRLTPDGDGTRVDLSHIGLSTPEEVESQRGGWRFHASRLALFANRDHLASETVSTIGAWFEAWNERDEGRRAELLGAACTDEIVFKDDYAAFEGRELLSLHIANSQKFMPGFAIERDGKVSICRGEAIVPWAMRVEGGEIGSRGVNWARVQPDGRLSSVTGFWAAAAPAEPGA